MKGVFGQLLSRRAWLILITYITGMIVLAIVLQQVVDREWLRIVVNRSGSLGTITFLVIEYFYVIFVPVYNTTIHLAAGYIFGGNTGWVLNFVATSAGLLTIITLVKRYGRPLLKYIVSKNILERYDKFANRIGPVTLFLVYVLPLFPDDEITYIIAASQVQFRRFLLPVLLGNVTKAAVSYIGDEGTKGIPLALGSRVAILVVGLILIGIQEYVHRHVQQRDKAHGG